jgi:4-aminobutyrate aminotransferase/(S)-3-amino-2-methylpropionate transaminase
LGGTYGGNPVACAAALAAIETMDTQDLRGRARQIEAIVKGRLGALRDELGSDGIIGDLRGRGGMLALEFVKKGSAATTKQPDGDVTKRIAEHCLKEGVIILTCGTYGNVIRLLPPLVIGDELLADGLDVLEAAIRANS